MTGGRRDTPGCAHRELAAGWALHALEPAEEILVAAHRLDCAECARAIAETELVGAILGLSAPDAVPSAELEQRVLSVTSTPQIPAVPPPAPLRGDVTRRSPRPPPIPAVWHAPPSRRGRQSRRGQGPRCMPETLVLITVTLLVFTLTFTILLYIIP